MHQTRTRGRRALLEAIEEETRKLRDEVDRLDSEMRLFSSSRRLQEKVSRYGGEFEIEGCEMYVEPKKVKIEVDVEEELRLKQSPELNR